MELSSPQPYTGLGDPVLVAVTEILHFKYPNEPLQGHLALTEDPTTMM